MNEKEPTLEGLLAGMSEEQQQALGREIFDAPGEGASAAADTSESGVPCVAGKPGRGKSAEDLLKEIDDTRCFALPPELHPGVIEQLQSASAHALDTQHLQLLEMALGGMDTAFDGETCKFSNPAFAKTLEVAINFAAADYYMKSPLEAGGCAAVQATLLLSVAAAAQPDARHWCDVRKFFADYQLLAGRKSKSDEEKAYFEVLSRVASRPLVRTPAQTPRAQAVLELVRTLPNFAEAITHMAEQLALHRMRQGAVFQPPPMLLLGPPGVGKSHFAQALAKLLGSTVHTLQFASQTNGWVLGGLDRGWGNAKPGQLFEALAYGDTLAPVIVLDEIDKANTDARNQALGPLYALLEPSSARKFRDEFVDFAMDTSQVIWIATANDEHAIPPALLSRFVVFRIEAPTGDELAVVLQTMYRQAAGGIPGAPDLMPPAWQMTCRGLSLRASRQAIFEAVGRAALRTEIEGKDKLCLLTQDMLSNTKTTSKKLGFLA